MCFFIYTCVSYVSELAHSKTMIQSFLTNCLALLLKIVTNKKTDNRTLKNSGLADVSASIQALA